jgi:hypothetical protein
MEHVKFGGKKMKFTIPDSDEADKVLHVIK